MPTRPRKTSPARRSLVERLVLPGLRPERAEGDAERAQRFAGQLLVRLPGSAARRSVAQGPGLLADQLLRAAREQHVGSALGEDQQALRPLGVAVDRAHQLALGGERHLPHAREARCQRLRPPARPCGRRRSSAPSVGSPCTVQRRPAPAARRCWRGRRRPSARTSSSAQRARRSRRRRRVALRLRERSRCPPASTRPLAVTTSRTVISFLVNVPVLSDAMTSAEPSVSTAARCRTIAFRFAMRWTPSESTAVTTAGRPSGTAATASATPRISTSKSAEKPAHVLDQDDRRDHHDGDDDHGERRAPCPIRSSSFCSGVVSSGRLLQHARRCAPSRSASRWR